MDLPPVPSINEAQPEKRVLREIVQYLIRLYNTFMGLQISELQQSVTIPAAEIFGNVIFEQVDDPSRIAFWQLTAEPVNEGTTYIGVSCTPFRLDADPLRTTFFIQKPVTSNDKTYTVHLYVRAR